jgi:hypothetical protein
MSAWRGNWNSCCCCREGEGENIATLSNTNGTLDLSAYKNRRYLKFKNKYWFLLNNSNVLTSGDLDGSGKLLSFPNIFNVDTKIETVSLVILCHKICGYGGYKGRVVATNAGMQYSVDNINEPPMWNLKPYKNAGYSKEIAKWFIWFGNNSSYYQGNVVDGELINLPDKVQVGAIYEIAGTNNGFGNYAELVITCGECVDSLNYSDPITQILTIGELFDNIYSPGMFGIFSFKNRPNNSKVSIYTDCNGKIEWETALINPPSFLNLSDVGCIQLARVSRCGQFDNSLLLPCQ